MNHRDLVPAALALAAVALAAGLEGGTEHRMGAIAGLVVAAAGAAVVLRGPLPRVEGAARLGGLLVLGVALFQVVPLPMAVHRVLAAGQSARLDRMAGEVPLTTAEWLAALTRYDVEVLFGGTAPWSGDVLAGASVTGLRAAALSGEAWAWQAGLWLAAAVLVVVGWRIAKSPPALLTVLLGLVAFAIGEALFGFANRNGPSTGIGVKVDYLGSATGTFINRGHFAAMLNLGLGAAWALSASLFPLLPEEVRRHAARKRRSSQPPGVLDGSGDKLPRLALIAFASATLFVGLVASNSRGPLVGLVLAGLAVGAWTRFRRDETVHLGLGVAAPAVGVLLAALALGPRGALGRFATVLTDDVSVTSRLELWGDSWSAWRDAPIFGAGLGAWSLAFGPHQSRPHLYDPRHAHSEPIELLVELGAVGLCGVLLLGFGFVRTALRRLDVVNHDLGASAAVGGLVALTALALQSIADFPLRTPGVLFPAALVVGVVLGGLGAGAEGGRRVGWAGAVLGVVGLLGFAGALDLGRDGARRERLSEQAAVLQLGVPDTIEAARAQMGAACAAAQRSPFDTWGQLACGLAASRVAAAEGTADEALVADIAVARALALHPRDPRARLQAAAIWTALGEPTLLPNAFAERATQALMAAVADDGWRAEAAFALARQLPAASADRIGAGASHEPVSRSRTLYQYGLLLEERREHERARAVLEEAATVDPQFGPPAFRAGLLARRRGDDEAARSWAHGFLAARNRPVAMEGWTYVLLGEHDAAEVRFRRALATDPKNRWAWEGVAAVERARGAVGAECEAWSRVLALTPSHTPARTRAAELGCVAPR